MRRQLGRRRLEALELLADFEGDTDRATVLLDGALEGLADPPGGVGRELEAALPVELLDGAQEPEGALLDEVDHLDAAVLVAAGPVQHQAQVGRDHLLLGLFVTGGDALGEFDLLVVVGHGVTVQVTHQEAQHVVGVHGGPAGGRCHWHLLVCGGYKVDASAAGYFSYGRCTNLPRGKTDFKAPC